MNKNEFYKNLMLTYTVDTEKVKRIAKRRVVKRSSRVMRILPGAAACAAVTAAAITIVSLGTFRDGREAGMDITGDEAAIARAAAAEQYYNVTLPDNAEFIMDMYVSFEHGLSYNEILLAFSKIDDEGNINIKLLYTAKGKYYENGESISADDKLVFLGAKISAPASMCRDIRLLQAVSLVELPESGITDDSFLPFGSSNLVTSSPEPVNTSFEIPLPSYTTANTTGTANTETSASDTEPEETTEGEVTDDTSDTTPQEAVTDIEIPVAGITTVNIINEERIVVTTADSIRLYRLQEDTLSLETTFYASNAKVSWKSYDGSSLFITACDSGARTRLYWADGKVGALAELDISAITSDGAEISSVAGTQDGRVTLLKTVTSDKSRIYTVRPSENALSVNNFLSINLVIEYDGPVTSLALIGNQLYYAYTDTKNSTVGIAVNNLADGTVNEIATYSGTLRSIRSQSFDSAALTFTSAEGEETCLLLTPDGALIETQLTNISFSRTNGRIFTDGEGYYCIEGDEIKEVDFNAEVSAAFAPAPIPGNYTCVIQEDGSAYLMLKAV